MRSRKPIAITILVLAVFLSWLATRTSPISRAPLQVPEIESSRPEPPANTEAVVPPVPEPEGSPEPAAAKPRTEASRAASRRDFTNPLVTSYPPSMPPPRSAAAAEPDVAANFDQITRMLRDYRTLTGENPVGTNAEIMQAIMGGNPKGAQLGPPEGQSLNENGELIDRWGTPYFFHQLSKDLMEIHSAGPDRQMGNDDDLIGN